MRQPPLQLDTTTQYTTTKMNYDAHVRALVEEELASMDTSKLHPAVAVGNPSNTTLTTLLPTTTTTTSSSATRLSEKYTAKDALPLVCAHAQARYLRTLAIHSNLTTTSSSSTADSPLTALAALEQVDLKSTHQILTDHVIPQKRQARDHAIQHTRDQRQKNGHVTGFLDETWVRRVNLLAASHVDKMNK